MADSRVPRLPAAHHTPPHLRLSGKPHLYGSVLFPEEARMAGARGILGLGSSQGMNEDCHIADPKDA